MTYGGKFDFDTMYSDASEKGLHGTLFAFFIWLILINPLTLLCFGLLPYFTFKQDIGGNIAKAIALVIGISIFIFVVASILMGILLYRRKPFTVKVAEIFVIGNFIISNVYIILSFIAEMINTKNFIASVQIPFVQLLFSVGFWLLWHFYLRRSTRVKSNYGLDQTEVNAVREEY